MNARITETIVDIFPVRSCGKENVNPFFLRFSMAASKSLSAASVSSCVASSLMATSFAFFKDSSNIVTDSSVNSSVLISDALVMASSSAVLSTASSSALSISSLACSSCCASLSALIWSMLRYSTPFIDRNASSAFAL